MTQYNYNNCPETIKNQIDLLVNFTKQVLRGDLLGIYLHGSLAMGCFNPQLSDIDILVVTRDNMTNEDRFLFTQELIRLSYNPVPIELSVITKHDIDNYEYPLKYEYHYSEAWREDYMKIIESKEQMILEEFKGTDPDLSAHIMIILHRGICLYGNAISDVFPSIPKEDYISAIFEDINYIRKCLTEKPVYSILNLCRVFWFITEGQVSSKEESGEWAMEVIPQKYKALLTDSLNMYRGVKASASFDMKLLRDFFAYITEEINIRFRATIHLHREGRSTGGTGSE
jgi:streptomycin 3"-adenylyltransferase